VTTVRAVPALTDCMHCDQKITVWNFKHFRISHCD